jgi:hypothetical protein
VHVPVLAHSLASGKIKGWEDFKDQLPYLWRKEEEGNRFW